MADEAEAETGFEIRGQFYKWTVSDGAKDLMLIDTFTKMPSHVFFEAIDDPYERARGPIMLALMATSINAAHPDWSVERTSRLVMDASNEATFIGGDLEEEGDADVPPEESADAERPKPSPKKSSGSPDKTSEKSPETPE
jgi:hypothetical protein